MGVQEGKNELPGNLLRDEETLPLLDPLHIIKEDHLFQAKVQMRAATPNSKIKAGRGKHKPTEKWASDQ